MDTEKIENQHAKAKAAAEAWHRDFKPVTYSVPFFIGGDWVRVTIELTTPYRVVESAADVMRSEVSAEA